MHSICKESAVLNEDEVSEMKREGRFMRRVLRNHYLHPNDPEYDDTLEEFYEREESHTFDSDKG